MERIDSDGLDKIFHMCGGSMSRGILAISLNVPFDNANRSRRDYLNRLMKANKKKQKK